MTLSNTIKNRFVKDYKLPIQVVQEPVFSHYIEELDSHFDTKQKLAMLQEVVDTLGGEDPFFQESNKVKTQIIEQVETLPVYKHLRDSRLDEYNVSNGVKQQDIYNMGNANRTFISIDLKHANFNVFKMYDPALVLNHSSYEELVGSVTDFDYFKKSKYLRQVIFGNLLPKKQQKLQKWVMDKIITVVHEDVGIAMDDFLSASSDEVVFLVDPNNIEQFVEMVKRKLSDNPLTAEMVSWCNVEAFTLKSIGDRKYFVKENCVTEEVEFKAIPSLFFMQVFKKYLDKELDPKDLLFYHEGFLAEFKQTVFEDE